MFLLLCASLAYWAFTEFMYRQADTPSSAFLWMNASSLWYFSIAFLIHFTLLFTEKTKIVKNKLFYLLIYAPALLFLCIDLINITVYVEPVKEFWGYTYNIPEASLVYWMSSIWAVAAGFFTFILCIKYYSKVTGTRKKQQAKFMALGFSIPVFLGSLSEMFLPVLEIRVPELTVISLTGLCIFVGYAIYKYNLFAVTPATAAETIIATMSDSLFLVDVDGKILQMNPSALDLLGYKEDELIGNSMDILFVEGQFGDELFKKLSESERVTNYETKYKTKSGEEIDISFSGSMIKDEEGKCMGIVGVAHDITERKTREAQLKEKIEELERFKKVNVGRELKMAELKKQIQQLKEKEHNGG